MAKEVERKFLVGEASWRGAVEASTDFVQFYLAISSDRSVRLRISDGRKAMILCEAALASARSGRFEPVKL